MDTLQDLLAKHAPQEPPEIQIVKRFVREKFDEPATVTVSEREITVTVSSSNLAGALRPYTLELLEKCHATDKRLVLRIGRQTG